jgi:hypothetical protein
MTGDGTVIARIAADVATDGANLNTASTSGDNNILYVANMTEHLISGNVGVGGVVLSYVDGTPKTVTSQANGNYSFPVSFNWTGSVTPAHACYTFSPIDQNYNQVRTDQTAQNYTSTFNSAAGCAEIDVAIRGTQQGQFATSPQGSTQASFAGMNKGPVKIESTNGLPFLSEQQVIYRVNGVDTSFSEMLALPNNQLDTIYWLPWYNNKTLNTHMRIANVSPSQASVYVSIGGVKMAGSPFTLAPGQSIRKSFAGIDKGPVKIESNVDIVASERVIYNVKGVDTSYSEMMALPNDQLDTIYWLPWYNSKYLDTQLRIANVSPSQASVHVSIGELEVAGSPFTLAPGQSIRKSFAGIDKGPVKIESNVDIVASERVVYNVNGVATSYSEMMALPNDQLGTTYWLPWYDKVNMDMQLRFANVSNTTATVRVFMAGVEVAGSPFTLAPGQSIRKNFAGINTGPVKIVSTQNIVAAERVFYMANGTSTSFSEKMGLPDSLLDTIYWLPWYDKVNMDTQLRFVVP